MFTTNEEATTATNLLSRISDSLGVDLAEISKGNISDERLDGHEVSREGSLKVKTYIYMNHNDVSRLLIRSPHQRFALSKDGDFTTATIIWECACGKFQTVTGATKRMKGDTRNRELAVRLAIDRACEIIRKRFM